jgi:hypothetical protein
MPANIPVQVRFPTEELSALDDYRRAQRNPPSRPQAIREPARAGLGEVTRPTIIAVKRSRIDPALKMIAQNPKIFSTISNADSALGAIVARGSSPPAVE